MSTRDNLDTLRPPTGADISGYEPPEGCQPQARVKVGNTRVPIINKGVRTELRRDEAVGEGYVTRHSEVYFPAKWPFKDERSGETINYKDAVDALDPNSETLYDVADVDIFDHVRNEYVTVHRGFVMGVGGGAEGDIEQRMTIGDAGQMLNTIRVPSYMQSYSEGTSLRRVLQDITRALEEQTEGIFSSVTLGELPPGVPLVGFGDDAEAQNNTGPGSGFLGTIGNGIDTVADGAANLGEGLADAVPGSDFVGRLSPEALNRLVIPEDTPAQRLTDALDVAVDSITTTSKEFDPSRDTVADVLRWVQRRLDGYFEMLPNGDTGLLLAHNRQRDASQYEASHLDGNVEVLLNNALYEVRPINTVTVFGESKGGSFPVAIASVPHLVESASGNLYQGDIHETDATETNIAENHATKELKNRVQGSSLGKIVTLPLATITPHANIKSRPNCGNQVAAEFPEVTWEVESVVHTVSAKEQDDRYRHQTALEVTPSVIIGEDTVTASGSESEVTSGSIRSELESRIQKQL